MAPPLPWLYPYAAEPVTRGGHQVPTINLQGRYRTTSRAPTGRLRPLRTAYQHG